MVSVVSVVLRVITIHRFSCKQSCTCQENCVRQVAKGVVSKSPGRNTCICSRVHVTVDARYASACLEHLLQPITYTGQRWINTERHGGTTPCRRCCACIALCFSCWRISWASLSACRCVGAILVFLGMFNVAQPSLPLHEVLPCPYHLPSGQ